MILLVFNSLYLRKHSPELGSGILVLTENIILHDINILICLRYHNCIIYTLFGLCFCFHLHQDMNPKLESVNKISQGFYLSNKDVSFEHLISLIFCILYP